MNLQTKKPRAMNKFLKYAAAALLLPFCSSAQSFHWEAPLDPVNADGYYRVMLTPEITAKLGQGFPDVRIYDRDSVETPYLIYKDEAHQGVDRFVTYQIVEKHLVRGCCSHITVMNSLGNAIDHIVLEVNNADAKREMTLSGSYDGVNFFTVKDHYTVSSFDTWEKGARRTTSLIRFDFPLTDYKFYRFDFDDWWWWWHNDHFQYPIFVVRAGYTEPTFIPEECLDLPVPAVTQTDSIKRKQTYVHISFPDSQYVDHLQFFVSTKKKGKDYYRAASLYELADFTEKGKTIRREIPLSHTILASVNSNEISIGRKRVKELLLKIENGDDQPLIIDSVGAIQVKHYLVAELEKDNSYIIRFGNDSIGSPVYDMQYFKAKIPAEPPVVKPGPRKDIHEKRITPSSMRGIGPEKKAELKKDEGLFKDKRVIWGAIGVVVLLLGFMTTKMLKEMKKKE